MHKLHNRIGIETRLLLLFYGIGRDDEKELTIMKHLILPTFSLRLLVVVVVVCWVVTRVIEWRLSPRDVIHLIYVVTAAAAAV